MKSLHLKQFLYSLLLVIVIPSVLVVNLFWHTASFNQTLNTELQQKATLFARAVSPLVVQSLKNPAALTPLLHTILDSGLGMKEITVYQYAEADQNFTTVTSTDQTKELDVLTNPSSNLAWKSDQSVASLETDLATGDRSWTVITPLHNSQNQKVALLLTKLSVADADALAKKSFQQSLIVLIASVVLIFILLFNHFHFVSYAKLYHDIQSLSVVRNTFMTRAAHDLESPIEASSRLATALAKHVDTVDDATRTEIGNLVTETTKAHVLMRALIAVQETERGQTITRSPINLARIAKELTEEMRSAVAEKDLHILTTIPNPQGIVLGDGSVAKQILKLMLDVCIEHIPHGSISMRYDEMNPTVWALTISSQSFVFESNQEQKTVPDINVTLGVRYWLAQSLASSIGGNLQAALELPQQITIQLLLPLDHVAQYPTSAEAVTTE